MRKARHSTLTRWYHLASTELLIRKPQAHSAVQSTSLTKAIFFLLFAANVAPATAKFGLNWPGTPVEPESPTPTKVVYDPPTDYGENDGVTPEIESLLRKYAPVIYLQ
jgi:hypothetical protein